MRRALSCALAACIAAVCSGGSPEFTNVAVTNAAEHRTDWRINAFDWSTAQSLGDGIDYLPVKLTTDGGWPRRMVCHVTRVDMSKPNVRFTGVDRCEGWGEPQKSGSAYVKSTLLEKTGDFMARYRGPKAKGGKARDMRVVFNSQGWAPWPSETAWGQVDNLCYSDGVRVSVASSGQSPYCPGTLIVWKDGTVDMVDTLRPADCGRVWYACAPVFCRLVTDGQVTVKRYLMVDGKSAYADWAGDGQIRPRTAMGLSQDKRHLFVLVIDGDASSWSGGASYHETAQVLIAAGCWQAINLDGGGSSNMVGWDDGLGKPMVLGRPSGGFAVSGQRSVGCHGGVYLAPILARVGTYLYDDADVLVRDIADGTTPSGERTVDVIGDLTFSEERPTLPAGVDFAFVSTNGSSIGWTGGKGRVANGTRVTFRGVRFAAGSRTLVVDGGGTAVLGDGADLDRIETADASGFVLSGSLPKPLAVACAQATAAEETFGRSELSLEQTRGELSKIVCATDPGLFVLATQGRDGVELKWTAASLLTAVKIKHDDATAVVSVDVQAAEALLGAERLLKLTVANEDGTATDEQSLTLTRNGCYSFTVRGAGFGYSFALAVVDAQGTKVPGVPVQEGVFTFGVESDWFSAEPPKSLVRGGSWTAEDVFTAAEGGKFGKVRIVTETCFDPIEAGTEQVREARMAEFAKSRVPHAALTLGSVGGDYALWYGLVRKNGTAGWERLYGAEVPDDPPQTYLLVEEVDFSSGHPRVRYFAGRADDGVAVLLRDADGNTAFDGAADSGRAADGQVTYAGCDAIQSLAGFSRVKSPSETGFSIILAKADKSTGEQVK